MATSEEFASSYQVFRVYFGMTPVMIIQLIYRIE
jgi:hypothetical protein